MEGKQCKQIKQFSAVAKESDYFLSLNDKSKLQRHKVKINNIYIYIYIQGYDPYQIKKEELSSDISTFPPMTLLFIFIESTAKGELKAYKILASYNQFTSGWVKEVKIKLFLNYLLTLSWTQVST